MSKRIANTRDKTAHFGRIRIGYHKRRLLEKAEKAHEQNLLGELDKEMKEKFNRLVVRVKQVIPKKLLRRTQIR